MLKSYQKLELTGLSFILISFFWQFFIDAQHDSLLKEWQFEHIEKRLDELHERQSELQVNQNALAEQLANNEKPWAKYLMDYKYTTPHIGGSKELSERANSFKLARVLLFLFGSLFLIIGKYIEFTNEEA